MSLDTFFTRLAKQDSFVIANGHIYVLRDFEPGKYVAVKGPSLTVLEAADRVIFRDSFAAFQKDYLDRNFFEGISKSFGMNNKLRSPLNFALSEVIPLIVGYGPNNAIDPDRTKKSVDELLESESKNLPVNGNPVDKVVAVRDFLLKGLPEKVHSWFASLVDRPIFVSNDFVYELASDESGFIFVEGVAQKLVFGSNVNDYSVKYNQVVNSHLAREALESCDVDKIAESFANARRFDALDSLIKKREVVVNNAGCVIKDNDVIVYLRIQKFAMRNPLKPDDYHPFPSVRVGVALKFYEGKVCHIAGDFCVDPLLHPFIQNPNLPLQIVCGDGVNVYDTASSVVSHLLHVANKLMNGLTKNSMSRHGALENGMGSYYQKPALVFESKKPLTREQAVKEGYVICNDWRVV